MIKALFINKLFIDPEKFISPDIKFERIISSNLKFSELRLNLMLELLKLFTEKSSFKLKSRSPSKYWFLSER